MLTHYSSYKVAEMFNVMSALAPGRVDLGVGRAPGGHHLSNIALQSGVIAKRNVDQFPQKLNEIAHYFKNTVPEGSVVKGLQTTPKIMEPAELWLLGSSNDSAKLVQNKVYLMFLRILLIMKQVRWKKRLHCIVNNFTVSYTFRT